MNFFHDITRKPWEASQGAVDDLNDAVATSPPAGKVALKVFFGVASVLFMLLSVAYAERMAQAGWRPLPESWLMWTNVGSLVLCSIAFQWAWISARRNEVDGAKGGLAAGGALTLVFLFGQLLAWQQLEASNFYTGTSPANSFFFLITGLHGLHLLGGLVVWVYTTVRLWRGIALSQLRLAIELCTMYWHFLLIIWIALFGLLFFPGGSLPVICRAFLP